MIAKTVYYTLQEMLSPRESGQSSTQEYLFTLHESFCSTFCATTKKTISQTKKISTHSIRPSEQDMLRLKMQRSLEKCQLQIPRETLFSSPIEVIEEGGIVSLRQKITLHKMRKVVVQEGKFSRKGRHSLPLSDSFRFSVHNF